VRPRLYLEAPLDNCVTVMDATMMEEYMDSLETIDTLDPQVSCRSQSEWPAFVFFEKTKSSG